MTYDPQKHNRQSPRMQGYDYGSPGWYFVTICTHDRQCIFGEIIDGKMALNKCGRIAQQEWKKTESIRDNVILDAFVIMPNHMHGIVGIVDSDNNVGAYRHTPPHRHTPLRDTKSSTESGSRNENQNGRKFQSPSKTLGAIVRGYKSAVTTQINKKQDATGQSVWQRNYHDHIIRDEQSLERIRYYIIHNPAQWQEDQNNPNNI